MGWRFAAEYRRPLVAIFIWAVGLYSACQCSAQTPRSPALPADFQSWDEVDISAQLNETLNLTFVGQGRLSSELVNPARYKVGADFNMRVWKHLLVTPSYYYFGFRTAAGVLGHGHAPILAATPIFEFARFTFSDRNRFIVELDRTGSPDYRVYGNRPKIDYRLGPSRWRTSVFLWDETFFYSKYSGLTKNRLASGLEKSLSDRLAVSIYLQRQDDDHSNPAHINTLGLQFDLRIR